MAAKEHALTGTMASSAQEGACPKERLSGLVEASVGEVPRRRRGLGDSASISGGLVPRPSEEAAPIDMGANDVTPVPASAITGAGAAAGVEIFSPSAGVAAPAPAVAAGRESSMRSSTA